ncbi:MAG: tetratricopeptide repeat protein [Pseudomonadota bacterium]
MRSMGLIVAMALTWAAPAAADIADDCEQEDDLALRVQGCSAVIASGNWTGNNLAWAYNNRGYAYNETGDYDLALQDLATALELDPQHGNAHHNRGVTYEYMGDHERAVVEWEIAIEMQGPDRVRWWQEWTRDYGGHYQGPIDGICTDAVRAALLACAIDLDC